ncbi:MAG: PDZ domain-containing protein, partial [Planctomycetota bacterium]
PVLFFFTGLHNDYHRPSDDLEKINFDGLERVCDMVTASTLQLSLETERPIYADTERSFGGVRRQLTVYLGISVRNGPEIFDVNGRPLPQSERLMLTQINPDTPASAAELEVGDILMKFDDAEIKTLTQLYDHLRKKSPGDPLDIRVIRGGVPVTVRAKLARR